jgi:hypothetical protein
MRLCRCFHTAVLWQDNKRQAPDLSSGIATLSTSGPKAPSIRALPTHRGLLLVVSVNLRCKSGI